MATRPLISFYKRPAETLVKGMTLESMNGQTRERFDKLEASWAKDLC